MIKLSQYSAYLFILTFWLHGYIIYVFFFIQFATIFFRINNGQHKFYLNWKDLLFVPVAIIGLFLNLDDFFYYVRSIIYIWIISIIFQNIPLTPKFVNRILLLIGITLFILIVKITFTDQYGNLHLSFQSLINLSRSELYTREQQEVSATTYGAYIGIVYLLLIVTLRFYRKYKGLQILLLLFIILLNLLAGKRAYWVGLAIGTIMIWFHGKRGYQKTINFTLFTGVFLIIFNTIAGSLKFIRSDNFYSRITALINFEEFNQSLSLRYTRWGYAMQDIISNPWGYGYLHFWNKYNLGSVHNEYLAQVLGLGIIGAFFYFFIFGYYLKRLYSGLVVSNPFYILNLSSLSVIIFVLVIGFTENYSFGSFYFTILLWVLIGLTGSPWNRNAKSY